MGQRQGALLAAAAAQPGEPANSACTSLLLEFINVQIRLHHQQELSTSCNPVRCHASKCLGRTTLAACKVTLLPLKLNQFKFKSMQSRASAGHVGLTLRRLSGRGATRSADPDWQMGGAPGNSPSKRPGLRYNTASRRSRGDDRQAAWPDTATAEASGASYLSLS